MRALKWIALTLAAPVIVVAALPILWLLGRPVRDGGMGALEVEDDAGEDVDECEN